MYENVLNLSIKYHINNFQNDSETYNKVLCLRLYGNLLKQIPSRTREAESNN